jgi:hypothetical protein
MLYDMKEDNAPKEFQTCSRSNEIGEKSNYLEKRGKPVGEAETPVLGR